MLIVFLCHSVIHGQTIRYYQLTKTRINGKETVQKSGGQFICIYDDFCYDSDKNGKGVGNGQLQLKNKENYIVYYGESYFGTGSYYKFSPDFSKLNVITPKGDIYAYKCATPSPNIKTCSLIKGRKGSFTPSNTIPVYSNNNLQINSGNNVNSNTTSRQKTKVTKKCAYCSGKGETIQHEYVSTFGQKGPSVYCNKCNQSWNFGTVHAHHRCNHCNGTGVYEYEY